MLTGIIALPLLIAFILKGSPFLFTVFVALCSFVGLSEFYRMALPGRKLEGLLASAMGAAIPFIVVNPDHTRLLFFVTLLVLFFALLILFRLGEMKDAAAEAALMLMGFLYVPLLLSHLALLRGVNQGVSWIFLLLLIVMAGDTAAYYVGSAWGKRKLYPRVSPNKSVEGSVGGLAGSILAAFIAKAAFFPQLALVDCVAVPLLLGPLGQAGDLFESMLKRSFGVKDSGAIIPGHGGILDRLDSILFAAPAAYYYAYLIFAGR